MPNLDQFKRVWKDISLPRKAAIISVGAGVLLAIGLLVLWANKPDMVPLYVGLQGQDMSVLEGRLKSLGIPYKLSREKGTILVPSKDVYRTRMWLATEGLPQGRGVIGFEIFDETKFTMTEFVQNVRYQRALQGELARSIMEMEPIEAARVHLSLPSPSLFIEEEKEPKASIILKIRPGERLSSRQIEGIVHLVSNAVEALRPENVTVVDTSSQILYSGEEPIPGLTKAQLDYKRSLEAEYEKEIKDMLEKIAGFGKVAVKVSADVDFSSEEQTVEQYDPTPVIASEERTEEKTQGMPNLLPVGVPGFVSNVYPQNLSHQSGEPLSYTKETTTTTYNQGRTILKKTKVPGQIKRISAAVIVDNSVSLPVAQLTDLVKSAIGYDATRGDIVQVMTAAFSTALAKDVQEGKVLLEAINRRQLIRSITKIGVIALLLLCIFLFLVRPLLKALSSKFHPEEIAIEAAEAKGLPPGEGEEEEKMFDEKAAKKQIVKIAEEEPEKIAEMIVSWVEEEETPLRGGEG